MPLLPEEGDAGGAAADPSPLGGEHFERRRALNAAVRATPHDEVAWIRLAESATDGASASANSTEKGPTATETSGLSASAERKIEVLRRAVETNPASEALRLALLQACDVYMPQEEVVVD